MRKDEASTGLLSHALNAWETAHLKLEQRNNLNPLRCHDDGQISFADEPLFTAPQGVHVLALGKCAHTLALSASQRLGSRLVGGFAIDHTHDRLQPPWITATGGHPKPTIHSLKSAQRLCDWLEALKPSDRLLVLMSGGASAMIELPAPGWSLSTVAQARMDDLAAGLSIDQINHRAAKRSLLKDGGLARRTPCPWRQLTVNDVADGCDGLVSSGPFLGLKGDDISLASHQTARRYATEHLETNGFRVWQGPTLTGEARRVGANLSIPEGYNALVQSGETTVLGPYDGLGGRNLELVGGWISSRANSGDWVIVCGASDGQDGNSQSAGAYWSSTDVVDYASLDHAMRRHNTAPWFESAGRLLKKNRSASHTGDLLILLRAPN